MTTRSQTYTDSPPGPPPGLPSEPEVLGRAASENFRVASRILPAGARRHLLAFYGFARLVDEIGDSYSGDRVAALDWAAAETRAALAGTGGSHPLIAGAAASVAELGVEGQLLFDLIEANRLDQSRRRYETFADLLGYCALSANPVGRLALAAFGFTDSRRRDLSDLLCTGLQLVEHCQDIREDAASGRVYLPAEDLRRFGVDPAELAGPGPAGPELRALMVFEASRSRRYLDAGLPLLRLLTPRARWAVAGFWAGGQAAIDALAAADFDVVCSHPRPRRARAAWLTVGAVRR